MQQISATIPGASGHPRVWAEKCLKLQEKDYFFTAESADTLNEIIEDLEKDPTLIKNVTAQQTLELRRNGPTGQPRQILLRDVLVALDVAKYVQ